MKRWTLAAVWALSLSLPALAQEHEGAAPEMPGWMWINFAILVIGLGYLISKTAPAMFQARDQEIRGGIEEAARKKKEADDCVSDIDRRLEGLAGEIEKLRAGISTEMSEESERMRQATERSIRRIEEQAQQEIGFLAKAASQQLRTYSADLALGLATRRIQQRMNRDTQRELVGDFISGLRHT